MSAGWYAHLVIPGDGVTQGLRVENAFEMWVDDPGYGYLWMRLVELRALQYVGLDDEGWEIALAGAQLGEWLRELTTRALCVTGEYDSSWGIRDRLGHRRRDQVPHWVTSHVARSLLPAFQKAVLLATAGTDRFEQTCVDEDDAPQPPICVRCDVDRIWASAVATSVYCDEHGHTPFGMVGRAGGVVRPISWETALECRADERARWDRERERERFYAELTKGGR